MMILQLVTESGHAVFRASSAFQRGKLDIKENCKMSTRFEDNKGNIEMLLGTLYAKKYITDETIFPRVSVMPENTR